METFSALLAICAGNSPVPGEFPTQRPVTRSFDVFFDCVWINGWVNNHEAVDLRRYLAYYDFISTIENLVWGTNTHLCNQSELLMDITKSNYISHQMEAQPPPTETNIEQHAICMKPTMQRMHLKMTTELVNTTTR